MLAAALALSGLAVWFILESSRPGDSASAWGLALVSVAIPTWVVLIIQIRSDVDWSLQVERLQSLAAAIDDVDAGIDRVATSSQAVRDMLSSLETTIAIVVEGIGDAKRAIDGLSEATERARQQAILTELTAPGGHRGFHGQASRLSGFALPPELDLSTAVLNNCEWHHFEADRVVLTGAQMRDLLLTRATANRAQLQSADLTNAYLAGSFAGGDLTQATINHTTLEGHWRAAKFIRCYVESASCANCDLREARFEDVDFLTMVCFWLADLSNAIFANVRLPIVDFRWADLTEAIFATPTPTLGDTFTSFEGALLKQTDFREVQLSSIRDWKMDGAIVEESQWPDGYDPAQAGALVVGTSDPELINAQFERRVEMLSRRTRCPDHAELGSPLAGRRQP